MAGVYYNEFNPESAAMLREMMRGGIIPAGDVDERSIENVTADEIRGYTQCHFFAGIGGWPIALAIAGWSENRPVWTGSCPCQPFSAAGQQKGKADARHLWPVWEKLISQCRPASVYGEQVATAIAKGWLDDVYQGLEPQGYAIGAAVLPACSVGAPHIRNRLWFVAHANNPERGPQPQNGNDCHGPESGWQQEASGHPIYCPDDVAHAQGITRRAGLCEIDPQRHGGFTGNSGSACGGHWGNGQWVQCPDGKARIIEPGISLLANGLQHRRPILHGIGNAILPQVAAEFITATKGWGF